MLRPAQPNSGTVDSWQASCLHRVVRRCTHARLHRHMARWQVLEEELAREAAVCEELLAVEPNRSQCKWPLLTLARLRRAQALLQPRAAGDAGSVTSAQAAAHCASDPETSLDKGGEAEGPDVPPQSAGVPLSCAACHRHAWWLRVRNFGRREM